MFQVDKYNITISASGDPTDVYFPIISQNERKITKFPTALFLQGALVDKLDYFNFAATVASYGFVVVVPNHERTVIGPTGQSITGLLAEQRQINDVLAQMAAENSNPSSPVANLIDTNRLGLLGHSFGGFVGLAAIQDRCIPGICSGNFVQPPELKAGIFYGTNFRNPPTTGTFPPIDNRDIPTALIAGSLDGVAELFEVEETYKQIQNPPKALVVVEGVNHYGITDRDNPTRDPVRPTLAQETSTETIARWSALFLRTHLLYDINAFEYIYETGDALDANVSVASQLPTFELVFGTLDSDRFFSANVSDLDGFRDLIFTGKGNDLVDATSGGGRNRIYGGENRDELLASRKDRLFGEEGDDLLDASVGGGNNRLYGGSGNDEIIVGSNDNAFGGDGNDTLEASTGQGNNRLDGGGGNDMFFLDSGNRAFGKEGDDLFFVNGSQDNIITGGKGADQFWIANAQLPSAPNTIADFEPGIDVIGIGGLNIKFSDLNLVNEGVNTIAIAGGNKLAIFLGIQSSSFSENDFVLR